MTHSIEPVSAFRVGRSTFETLEEAQEEVARRNLVDFVIQYFTGDKDDLAEWIWDPRQELADLLETGE